MNDVEKQWAGQCEAWWDAHTCQPVSAPKNPQPVRIMRCVMEAGHEPIAETAAAGGHNFGGLGPYTPGMPGWKAQRRALGLPDDRPRGVDVSWEVPPGTPEWQREVWSRVEKVARDVAVDAIAEALGAQLSDLPKGGGHYSDWLNTAEEAQRMSDGAYRAAAQLVAGGELTRLRREHELLRATLGNVLAQFTDNSYLGQPCSRTAWIPAEVVASWCELHASVAVDQLKEGQEQ